MGSPRPLGARRKGRAPASAGALPIGRESWWRVGGPLPVSSLSLTLISARLPYRCDGGPASVPALVDRLVTRLRSSRSPRPRGCCAERSRGRWPQAPGTGLAESSAERSSGLGSGSSARSLVKVASEDTFLSGNLTLPHRLPRPILNRQLNPEVYADDTVYSRSVARRCFAIPPRISIETVICWRVQRGSERSAASGVVVDAGLVDAVASLSEERSASIPATTSNATTPPAMSQVMRVRIIFRCTSASHEEACSRRRPFASPPAPALG
jgi:hypothetical protein